MRTITAVLLVLASVMPASAQIGNPAGMAPGSADAPNAASVRTNTSDVIFTRLVAAGGSGEVEFGQLAQRKSRNDGVKMFADRMVADHGKANARLAALTKQFGIAVPRGVDPDQSQVRAELSSLDGGQFDVRYMEIQVTDHVKAAQLLEWELGSGQNADIQHFAADTLSTVLEHLQMAREVLLRVRAQAPLPRETDASAPSRRR